MAKRKSSSIQIPTAPKQKRPSRTSPVALLIIAGIVVLVAISQPRNRAAPGSATVRPTLGPDEELISATVRAQLAPQVALVSQSQMTATPVSTTLFGEPGALRFELEGFELRMTAGEWTAREGYVYLVVFGTLINEAAEERCAYARTMPLMVDGVEYRPNNGLMGRVQATERRDYLGAYQGQCVAGGATERTFAAFEIPLQWTTAELVFEGHSQAVTLPQEIAATATIIVPTRTRIPRVTAVPVTPRMPTSAAATTPTLGDQLAERYGDTTRVREVGLVNVQPTANGFVVYAEIVVAAGYNNEAMAAALKQIAHEVLVTARLEFGIILDDGQSVPASYDWDNQTDEWRITPLTSVAAFNAGLTATERAQSTPASTRIPVTRLARTVYYVLRSANARSCPDTRCASLGQFAANQSIGVEGAANGASVSGSALWYRTTYNGQVAYVHSSLVSLNPPPTAAPVQPQPTQPPISQPPPGGGFACDCNKLCSAIASCEEAYFQLQCGCTERDSDSDGIPCESICGG